MIGAPYTEPVALRICCLISHQVRWARAGQEYNPGRATRAGPTQPHSAPWRPPARPPARPQAKGRRAGSGQCRPRAITAGLEDAQFWQSGNRDHAINLRRSSKTLVCGHIRLPCQARTDQPAQKSSSQQARPVQQPGPGVAAPDGVYKRARHHDGRRVVSAAHGGNIQ